MRSRACRLGSLAAVSLLAAAPVGIHFAVVTHRAIDLAVLLVAAEAAMVGWVAVSLAAAAAIGRAPGRWWAIRLGVCLALAGLAGAICQGVDGLVLAAAVPHAVTYLGLLALFAASLSPGREPVVTMVARRTRGALNVRLQRYTRGVTWAWCGFFVVQLLTSVLLWLLAPLAWWSFFINLGTVPLVLLMFAAELAYRHWRHGRDIPEASAGWLGFARRSLAELRAVNQTEAMPHE
jgi:uncharacterized membrane protein